MPVLSAHDVAAELRRRLPGVGQKKLHKLLYYCQGHHLATYGEQLYGETISAYDMGPVVGTLWHREQEQGIVASDAAMTERELNTIGYVLSRYGALSPQDLVNLTHNEPPWKDADAERLRKGARRATITNEAMRDYFRDEPTDELDGELTVDLEELAVWLSGASERRQSRVSRPDSVEEIRRRLTEARG